MYVCVRAHTCAFVHVRLCPCLCVCVRALASAFVRVRASAFVCVHMIKSPDASARIISDASGRVFRSRTFEMHYILKDFSPTSEHGTHVHKHKHTHTLQLLTTTTLLALSIHCSINSWNCFLRGFGGHNFEKKAAVRGYHTYLYCGDSRARRGHVASRMWL